jgi:outer membrane protein assembly factor BamD
MIRRVPMIIALLFSFACWSNTGSAEQAVDDADQQAAKEMDVGRWYIGRRDYAAAVNRFKTVVIHYQASRHVEEALAHLVEAYLRVGIPCEAQNQAAVLSRQFPDGRWTATAREALQAAGFESRRCY